MVSVKVGIGVAATAESSEESSEASAMDGARVAGASAWGATGAAGAPQPSKAISASRSIRKTTVAHGVHAGGAPGL